MTSAASKTVADLSVVDSPTPAVDASVALVAPANPFARRKRLLVAVGVSALLNAVAVLALGLISIARPMIPTIDRLNTAVVRPDQTIVERLPEPRVVEPPSMTTVERTVAIATGTVTPNVAPPKAVASAKTYSSGPTVALDVRTTPQLLADTESGKYKMRLGQIRSPAQRMQAVLYRGGNEKSEQAVAAALVWLARHQNADGGWSFDHRLCGDCKGQCRNPGTLARAQAAATSLALLPFLAAGHTHKQGPYKKQVDAGLRFIVRNMQPTTHGGSFTQGGGTMYAQALATIALCEALAMTRDKDLIAPAQTAAAYIINTQDPRGGGWRYFPGMPGDTSVTGWQLMALKSADNAYIPVPAVTIERMRTFFDYVQQNEGAAYGYVTPELASTASTPVGLLSRMTLGWKRDEPPLVRGVEALSTRGPKPDNVYYNFYATQVLHHFGGPHWEQWNAKMRDALIVSQVKEGHEAGSWFAVETGIEDQQASLLGGRLYVTALAALTLEVYYRYLPLYGNRIFLEEER